MANIKSQMKRNRQNEKLRLRNKALRSEMKTRMQNAIDTARSGDAEATANAYRLAQQNIDKAATKGIIPKNTAARRKSNLARQIDAALS
jgi:small subunit ribosomal protein S20